MRRAVWLITGAGRGLGADIAKAALAAGHAVVATGRVAAKAAAALGNILISWLAYLRLHRSVELHTIGLRERPRRLFTGAVRIDLPFQANAPARAFEPSVTLCLGRGAVTVMSGYFGHRFGPSKAQEIRPKIMGLGFLALKSMSYVFIDKPYTAR